MNSFGFPLRANFRFRIGKRWYLIGRHGVETLQLLRAIYEASIAPNNEGWALRERPHIRRIELLNTRAVLTLLIDKTTDPQLRRLAIWLRGRCGGYMGTGSIAAWARSADLATEKECVRALKRLSGWEQLREIASFTQHARVRTMATQHIARPYKDRLSRVLTNVRPIPKSVKAGATWMFPGLILQYTPAKSLERIRHLLAHIRSLVSASDRRSLFSFIRWR